MPADQRRRPVIHGVFAEGDPQWKAHQEQMTREGLGSMQADF
jgi:hypothetical protein